jgi:hypothetical protein
MKTMKAWLLVAVILIIIIFLLYMGFAFINLTFNPHNWSSGQRFTLVFIVFIYCIISPLVFAAIDIFPKK